MKVNFYFEFGEEVTPEQLLELEECLGKKVKMDEGNRINNYVLHSADLVSLYGIKSDFKIKISGLSADKQMARLAQQMNTLELKIDGILNNGLTFNEKCDVHVGGFALLNINETKVAEDCCTEALDEFMEKGWRILAVCVQPDQRRPDYVLGRTNRNRA